MPRLAALFVLAVGVGVAPSAARADTPSLYANYVSNCTFAFVTDGGGAVTTLAPGTYQVVIFTPFAFSNGSAACEFVQFRLAGPGVSLTTDLGSGDAEVEQHTVTLQPGATYTVQDDGHAAQTRRSFAVATSGSAGSSGGSSSSSSSSTSSATKGTASKDIVGSALLTFRGSLDAAVSKAGKLTLTKARRAVASLRAGRYTFRVVDGSTAAGFVVQPVKGTQKTLATAPFTGTKSVTVSLAAGQWFYSTPGGAKHPFVVTR
jgi:hypothetical protein